MFDFSIDFSFALLLPIALILILLSLVLYYLWALMPRSGTVEWIHMRDRPPFRFIGRYRLDWIDVLIAVLLVALWAGLSFWNLGSREAPESFHRFEEEYVVIDLGAETNVGAIRYYSGLNTGQYALYFSEDGTDWTRLYYHDRDGVRQYTMRQTFIHVFKWNDAVWENAEFQDGARIRYIRLRADTGTLYLGELAIYDISGNRLDPQRFNLQWSMVARATDALFDEQDVIPDRATFFYEMYFDEIYHGRTAYEHTVLMDPYEISHPPLGKLIISIGIRIFGMTPFGWRFMGALSGALILGILYFLIKNLFGKRLVAVCGTLVYAFSFMHFAQTRIATIDTYSVLFVLLMFWFMYRYVSLDYETPFHKTLLDLGLAGLFFGLGAAAKWTSVFLAPALAVLWLMYQIFRARHWRQSGERGVFGPYLAKTIAMSCVFFVLVPAIIYYLSYIPYSQARGYGVFSPEHLHIVIENQRFMFGYHGDGVLGATHPFSSYWWEWVLNTRPILYYVNTTPDGLRSSISAFGNPLVYWGGLLAIFAMPLAAFRRGDGRAFAILLSYLSLLLPWMFISRLTFAYHYFTNIIFLALAIAYVFDHLIRRERGLYKTVIIAFTALAGILFAMFYPALSGLPMPQWYFQNVLRWFASWPV